MFIGHHDQRDWQSLPTFAIMSLKLACTTVETAVKCELCGHFNFILLLSCMRHRKNFLRRHTNIANYNSIFIVHSSRREMSGCMSWPFRTMRDHSRLLWAMFSSTAIPSAHLCQWEPNIGGSPILYKWMRSIDHVQQGSNPGVSRVLRQVRKISNGEVF